MRAEVRDESGLCFCLVYLRHSDVLFSPTATSGANDEAVPSLHIKAFGRCVNRLGNCNRWTSVSRSLPRYSRLDTDTRVSSGSLAAWSLKYPPESPSPKFSLHRKNPFYIADSDSFNFSDRSDSVQDLFIFYQFRSGPTMGRLDRDDLADAASSHSLHSIAEDDLPPPYTDDPEIEPVSASNNTLASSSSRPTGAFRPLRIVDAAYAIPGTKNVHSYDTRVVSLDPRLCNHEDELFHVIRRQLKLPVRPMLLIKGTHTESSNDGKKKNSNTVTDFEFRLDLAETMLTGWEGGPMHVNWMEVDVIRDGDDVSAYRGGIMRSREYKAPKTRRARDHAVDSDAALLGLDTEAGIDADIQEEEQDDSVVNINDALKLWCERFCSDPSPVKSYVPSLNPPIRAWVIVD